MRYLITSLRSVGLVLLLGMFGCSSGPILKKDCSAISGRDAEYVCGKAQWKNCVGVPTFDGSFACEKN